MKKNISLKCLSVFLAAALLISSGCIGAFANLHYVLHGLKVDAEYEGLEDSRVAVVIVSDGKEIGHTSITDLVGRAISIRLQQNVEGIALVPQNVIENWKETHAWDGVDFREIGKGVNADKVIGVEIDSYSLFEGATLLKGRSTITATVFDLQDKGNPVFSLGPEEYNFPESHARPRLNNEKQFEAVYLAKIAEHIARNFYAYDKAESVAEDATGLGFH